MSAGRKKEFDRQQALESAMHVFWKKGYGGASMSDLTREMGINKPSLYATFGNKETLFIEATGHYLETVAKSHSPLLEDESTPLKTRLKRYLMSAVEAQCDPQLPKGCYLALCSSEAEGEALPEGALKALDEAGTYNFCLLERLFATDAQSIALQLDQQASDNARFLLTVLHGTAGMARSGETPETLEAVIDRALAGLGL